MTREEILKKVNDWEEIKIYKYHKYIEAKIELGEDNLATQIAKREWLDAIESLKYYLNLGISEK
jgi:hypothetical protein